MGYDLARALAWEYMTHPDKISSSLKPRIEDGMKVTREEYDEMRATAERRCRAFADDLRNFDFPLTLPSEAPASLASTGDPAFNRAWTLLGVPCVTLYGKGPSWARWAQPVGPFDADSAPSAGRAGPSMC